MSVRVFVELGTIICLGESLVDVMPSGREEPGGAPANVAFHAASAATVGVAVVSRVGDDAHGHCIAERIKAAGVGDGFLQVDSLYPTGVVRVSSGSSGPVYEIGAPAAWDFIGVTDEALDMVCRADVVVFGTLAQRHPVSRATIRALIGRARVAGAFVVADLNLRAPFFDEDAILWSLRHCDLLKLSGEELSIVGRLLGAQGDAMTLFEGLVREFCLCRAVLTAGGEGAWFFEDGRIWHQPAYPAEVADTVGVGDAFTAVLAVALARGISLAAAAPLAAEVAAYVVSQPGAMPVWPEALVRRAHAVLGG